MWEWTRTLWGKNPSAPDFNYPYDSSAWSRRPGASAEILRVVRGGSYKTVARGTFVPQSRIGLLPIARTRTVGLRVALTASNGDCKKKAKT